MRLRQIALVAGELGQQAAAVAAVLGLGAPYADPAVAKYGLRNAVFPVGDTFLEIVSPSKPGTTAGRLLEKRGGDGGYMVILQANDIAAARARILAANARIVDQADLDRAAFTHVHPKDTGGAILSIDAMRPAQHWEWGGPDWQSRRSTDTPAAILGAILGAELQGSDPAAMAARWAEIIGRACAMHGDTWRIALDQSELRFVRATDGRGEGLGAIDIAVRDREAVKAAARHRGLTVSDACVELCGVRVNLLAP
jgi:hypothetical protein